LQADYKSSRAVKIYVRYKSKTKKKHLQKPPILAARKKIILDFISVTKKEKIGLFPIE
jgi:hypothetical protein